MSARRLLVTLTVAAVVLAGCAGQDSARSAAATQDATIAKAQAEEAKAKAAEAKAKATEAAAKAERAKADAKRARSEAATAGKAPAGSSSGTSAAGSSYSSPTISISCNPENYAPNVHFGGGWRFSTSTATLLIDYGDGRHYTTSHIPYFRSAYRHTYNSLGYFLVNIRLIDGRGNVATDSCSTGVHIFD
jgi:hypothetical protein